MKKLNFYAGPAILPQQVLQQAAAAIADFSGMGLSILEISHRSKEFVAIMDEACALVRELMQLSPEQEVIFMHGGALSQFHLVPMNLLSEGETASYFDTGTWAHGAITEAKLFGHVHLACSSKADNYTYIPKEYSIAPGSKYLHITSNNTIYGTQLSQQYIETLQQESTPLVCDMSSDIFSRRHNFSRFGLIYAGAQKNMGAAGVTMVVVNKSLLGKTNRAIPRMLDYRLHIEKGSMLNTPSVFAVYVTCLTLRWIKEQGLEQLEQLNTRKAELLYTCIDSSQLYQGTVQKDSRSQMNVCFLLKDKNLDERFNSFMAQHNIAGLKGHRSVGGFRASLYNAMDEAGVQALVDAMKEFERTA